MRRDLVLAGAAAAVVLGSLASLSRVFSTTGWRAPVLAALLLALAVATAARRVRAGALASGVASVTGLVVFTYVLHLGAGPLLPGAEQAREALGLLREGLLAFRDQPAPVAPLDGLMLIVTTAVWAVTHLTHELLVRWRRVALALAPPATLWIVPLAVPLPPGRTWPQALPFLAGAGLVLLLAADADVTDWTRDTDATLPSGAGLSVGAAALAVAALLPGLVPGYGARAWVDLSTTSDPRGYQPIVDVGDRLKLPAERDVLQVRADRRVYLRLAGLDTFDGSTWRLGPSGASSYRPDPEHLYRTDGRLPYEVPIREQSRATAEVTVLDLANIYLPVPYQAVELRGPERDEMIYSTEGGFLATWQTADNQIGGELRVGVREGLEYTVVSAVPDPSVEQLREVSFDDADLSGLTELPGEFDALRTQAEEVYAAVGAESVVDRALALQDWFAGEDADFDYDLEVPELRGEGALNDFVFETKTGYCEYFATAMAVMLRTSGIPARVAVGFLPGDRTAAADPERGEELDTYTVTTEDAHAWVEVLFPEYGWIRFEPTPRSDGATMRPEAGDLDPELTERELRAQESARDGDDPAAERDLGDASDDEEGSPNVPEGLDAGAPAPGGDGAQGGSWPLAALAALTVAGAAVLFANRRQRPDPSLPDLDRVLAAQRRVQTTARRYGVGRRPSETTMEATQRWIADGRAEPAAAQRLASLGQAAAFGGDVQAGAGDEADGLAAALGTQLRASVATRDRMVAPVRVPIDTASRLSRTLVAEARARWPRGIGNGRG